MRLASAAPAAGVTLALGLVSAACGQTMDRYGGGLPAAPYAVQQPQAYAPPSAYGSGSVRAYPGMSPSRSGAAPVRAAPQAIAANAGLRTLSWPGKDPSGAAPVTAMASYPRPAPIPYTPAPMPSYAQAPAYGAPQRNAPGPIFMGQPQGPAPTYAFAPPPLAGRAPAPTSIYSDAPASTVQPPQAYAYTPAGAAAPQTPAAPALSAANGGSRQYSVHREYGLTPDAAPIPPQFFANTADLSAPETPDVVTTPRVTINATTAKATENAARLAASAAP